LEGLYFGSNLVRRWQYKKKFKKIVYVFTGIVFYNNRVFGTALNLGRGIKRRNYIVFGIFVCFGHKVNFEHFKIKLLFIRQCIEMLIENIDLFTFWVQKTIAPM